MSVGPGLAEHPFEGSTRSTARRDLMRAIQAIEAAILTPVSLPDGEAEHYRQLNLGLRKAYEALARYDMADDLHEMAEREEADGV
ncbi:MAG TPA: hypothetical protein VEA38_11245 [Terriglobales bacterium]|nr:hypothetical protein [Terriglobales bacterium]